MSTTPLLVEEAVPLGHAMVHHLAVKAGVRAMAIKGPVLSHHGLRSGHQSIDVDVLVEPNGLDDLRAGLEGWGWVASDPRGSVPGIVPHHSVTLRRADWPCEIDLHHRFPGFLAPPEVVFDVLWARRTDVELAGVPVTATDLVSTVAITGLHYLRDAETPWGRERLDALVLRTCDRLASGQLDELSRVATKAGAGLSLEPLLLRVGAPLTEPSADHVIGWDDWQLRSRLTNLEVVPWLVGWQRTSWQGRPAFLWHALWNGSRQFQEWDRSVPGWRRALLKARLVRLRRALRALPRAARHLRELQRR